MLDRLLRRNPELMAWLALGSGFTAFCFLALGVVLGVLWYRNTATEPRDAKLTIISGTVWVQSSGQAGWDAAAPNRVLKEGDSIRTVDTSEALLTLFDKSTVILYPQAEVTLAELRTTRFEPRRHALRLYQRQGRLRLGVAPEIDGEKRFQLSSPHAEIHLVGGSYNFHVGSEGTQVGVQENGRATVMAQNRAVELRHLERTTVPPQRPPEEPRATKEQLVRNGGFLEGLGDWQTGNTIGFREGQDVEGQVNLIMEGGRPAVHFLRRGSRGTHNESWIYQEINKDVSGLSSLRLSFDFRIVHQNLSGGGYEGSEYPVLVRLNYDTPLGKNFGVWGFYYQNDNNNRTDNGTEVPHQLLTSFTVPTNLMTLVPPPRKLLSLQLSASGWDYESFLYRVSLEGE